MLNLIVEKTSVNVYGKYKIYYLENANENDISKLISLPGILHNHNNKIFFFKNYYNANKFKKLFYK